MRIHTFQLDFHEERPAVQFPFILDGRDVPGFFCALSVRAAGDMGYDSEPPGATPNRSRFFESFGVQMNRVRTTRQTHSRLVAAVDGASIVSGIGDGLSTADASVILSVTVADCLPIYLLDTEHGVFSLLHSGWKGTGIVSLALSLMAERWGTRAAAVSAILGPCIRGCCYEVDPDRASVFEAEFGPEASITSVDDPFPLGPVVRRVSGRNYIDLQAANARLLAAAGISDLAVCQNCTYTDERLGSFRREGSDRFTRMAAAVGVLS